jgi:hypothetical protein
MFVENCLYYCTSDRYNKTSRSAGDYSSKQQRDAYNNSNSSVSNSHDNSKTADDSDHDGHRDGAVMSSSMNDVAARNTSSTNNRGSTGNTNDYSDNRWRAGSDRLYSSYGVNAGDNFTNNSSGVNNSGGLLSAAVRKETVLLKNYIAYRSLLPFQLIHHPIHQCCLQAAIHC